MACKDCFSGEEKSGIPQGKMHVIDDLPVYVAEPKTFDGRVVVLYHDAFGGEFINNRLQADVYAREAGVRVYLPDFLQAGAVPASVLTGAPFDWPAWLKTGAPMHYDDKVVSFAKAIKGIEGVKSIGAIGFCWGGHSVLYLAGLGLIDNGAVAHPSFVMGTELLEKVQVPFLFLCAEEDQMFPLELQETAKKIMAEKKEASGLESKFVFYPGTKHGFAVRGVMSDEVSVKAAEDAVKQAVEWWNRLL